MCGHAVVSGAEVARAEPHSYAADIWSLGCVALELARGKRLYSELHAFAVGIRLAQGASSEDPRPIPHGELDPLVDDFVTRCLIEDWRQVSVCVVCCNGWTPTNIVVCVRVCV